MSYQLISQGLQNIVQLVGGFGPENVAYEDFKALNAGMARAVVLEYESFNQERLSMRGGRLVTWTIKLNLFNQFMDLVESQAAQDADRQAILDTLDHYPCLGGTANVLDALVVNGLSEPAPTELGGALFLKETMTVQVQELVDAEERE